MHLFFFGWDATPSLLAMLRVQPCLCIPFRLLYGTTERTSCGTLEVVARIPSLGTPVQNFARFMYARLLCKQCISTCVTQQPEWSSGLSRRNNHGTITGLYENLADDDILKNIVLQRMRAISRSFNRVSRACSGWSERLLGLLYHVTQSSYSMTTCLDFRKFFGLYLHPFASWRHGTRRQ